MKVCIFPMTVSFGFVLGKMHILQGCTLRDYIQTRRLSMGYRLDVFGNTHILQGVPLEIA